MSTRHAPVLLEEVLDWLKPSPVSRTRYCLVLDATVGGGGHAEAMLSASENVFLIGVDQDAAALKRTGERLKPFTERSSLQRGNFSEVKEIIAALSPEVQAKLSANNASNYPLVDRILVDLGISSDQLDDTSRGFSFASDSALDMRMNSDSPKTAAEVLNTYSRKDLEKMFTRGGVQPSLARSIANGVIAKRPFERTREFVALCAELTPAWLRKRKGLSDQHPATVPFQALRIEVNDELKVLSHLLDAIPEVLAPGGRLAVISFHSGEDKIVTAEMRKWSRPDSQPRGLPIDVRTPAAGKLLTGKAVLPSEAEIERNSRARSARLRVFEKTI